MTKVFLREDDGPSEVYGSPPLEHDVAVTEAGRNAESHATANFGAFWDGVEDLDQVQCRNLKKSFSWRPEKNPGECVEFLMRPNHL